MPTKAELEKEVRDLKLHIKAMNDQSRTWGNEALALAQRKGYCNDIQTFLDEQQIPYDKPDVKITVNVTFQIDAVMADAQTEEFTEAFVESCFHTRVFEEFPWGSAHDSDINEIEQVTVTGFTVAKVERRD